MLQMEVKLLDEEIILALMPHKETNYIHRLSSNKTPHPLSFYQLLLKTWRRRKAEFHQYK